MEQQRRSQNVRTETFDPPTPDPSTLDQPTAIPPTMNPPTMDPPIMDPVHESRPTAAAAVPPPAPIETHAVATRSSARLSPAAVVAGASAVVLLVWGGVALARAGVDAPFDEPVIEVAGLSGTAVVALIAIGVGIVMLLAAVARSRSAIVAISVLLGVAGAVVAIEPTVGEGSLGLERSTGVAALVLAAIVVIVALVTPDIVHTAERIER